MVIRLVTMGQFLFPYFLPQLFIHKVNPMGRRRLVLKCPAHMVQEPGNGLQQER